MLQNIKSDIIYYKTNTDFELEFNLCGCCRMRLLTDKSPDRKTLVNSLARAVSRSRVIIVIGSLFGEEGVMSIVANAIGSKLAPIDNKAFNIESDQEIQIINGATPLVTPEGYFGGCIIESGPQTMILLSDSKSIRKTIMTNLIHPYIEELYSLELQESQPQAALDSISDEAVDTESVSEEKNLEPVPEETKEPVLEEAKETAMTEEIPLAVIPETDAAEGELSLPTDSDDLKIQDVTETEKAVEKEETETEEVLKEENDVDYSDESSESEIADEYNNKTGGEYRIGFFKKIIKRNKSKDYFFTDITTEDSEVENFEEKEEKEEITKTEDYKNIETHEDRYDLNEEEGPAKKRKGKSLKLAMLIIMILLLALLAVLCYCIFYVPSSEGTSATAYLQEIYNTLF